MKKRKILFGTVLASLLLLIFPHESNAYGELDRFDGQGMINNVDYFYSNSAIFMNTLSETDLLAPGASLEFPKFSVKKANEFIGYSEHNRLFDLEGDHYTLEGVQYLTSVKNMEFRSFATDMRPLENLTNLETLSLEQPLDSLDFLSNLISLKAIDISATNVVNSWDEEKRDENLTVFTDLSVLNSLNKLEYFSLTNIDRLFVPVVLKKTMNKYSVVNPFILPHQFDNGTVKIESSDRNFSFKDDILEWSSVSTDVKEFQISWEFKSPNGKFIYNGKSVIPVYWK